MLCLAGQPGIQSAEQGRGVRDKLEAVHGYVHTLGLFRCTFLKQKRALGVKGLAGSRPDRIVNACSMESNNRSVFRFSGVETFAFVSCSTFRKQLASQDHHSRVPVHQCAVHHVHGRAEGMPCCPIIIEKKARCDMLRNVIR